MNKTYEIEFEMSLTNYCTICYDKKGLKLMTDVFSSQGNIGSNLDAIFFCFNIQFLRKHHGLENMICRRCIAKLKYCCGFRKAVETAHQNLYNIVDYRHEVNRRCNEGNSYGGQYAEQNIKQEIMDDDYEGDSKEWFKHYALNSQSGVDDVLMFGIETDDVECEYVDHSTKPVNDETYNSDWSVDTDDILRVTGYWEELEEVKRREQTPMIQPLDMRCRTCPICSKTFAFNRDLKSHYPRHYPMFLCEICGSMYSGLTQLKDHLVLHKNKSYGCQKCGKTFRTYKYMRDHCKRRHDGYKPYKCTKCKARFISRSSRQNHLVDEHYVEKKMSQCHLCDFVYSTSIERRRHLKEAHFKEIDFKCLECSLVFLQYNEMQLHMVKHKDEKEFECDYCKKQFARRKTLREHLKIHLNIKNYVCNECNKAFVQKAAMKSHARIHCKSQQQ